MRALEESTRSLEYLTRELQRTTSVEIHQAIYRLIEAQSKTSMLANVQRDYAFRFVDPAVVPDPDRFVRPRRALLVAAFGFSALILAAVCVLFLAWFRHGASSSTAI